MNWIKTRRKELHISQSELAIRLQLKGLDISQSSISNWENDIHTPPLDSSYERQLLAESLELDVQEMLLLAGYEVAKTDNEIAIRAAIIVDNLPIDLQKHALEYLKMLEKQAKAVTH